MEQRLHGTYEREVSRANIHFLLNATFYCLNCTYISDYLHVANLTYAFNSDQNTTKSTLDHVCVLCIPYNDFL